MNISPTCNRFDGSRTAHHGVPGITEISRFGTALRRGSAASEQRIRTKTRPRRLLLFFPFFVARSSSATEGEAERAGHTATHRARRVGSSTATEVEGRSAVRRPPFLAFESLAALVPRTSSRPRGSTGDLFPSAASERRDRVRQDGGRPPDQPRQGAQVSLCVPDPRRRPPRAPRARSAPPAPRARGPPAIRAWFFARASDTAKRRARPDPPSSLTRPSPAAPSDSQSSSRSRSRRRSACTTPAPPRWPSR